MSTSWSNEVDEAFTKGDWETAVRICDEKCGTDAWGPEVSSAILRKWVRSLVKLEMFDEADRRLGNALSHHPSDTDLWREKAERSMMLADYREAMTAWHRWFGLRDEGKAPSLSRFPLRGGDYDWFESAWAGCAEVLSDSDSKSFGGEEPEVWLLMLSTLGGIGEQQLAADLAGEALRRFPHDSLVVKTAANALAAAHLENGVHQLLGALGSAAQTRSIRHLADSVASSERLLDDLKRLGPPSQRELRVLTVYKDSGADFVVRSSDFWDEARVNKEALRLAKRDAWPEQYSSSDLVSERAWEQALAFADSHHGLVGVSAQSLAQAVFHYLKQEIIQKIPVDRIAAEIARTSDGAPVFLDLGASRLPYLVSHPTSRMQTIYFYDALRRLGCNVYLVRFPRERSAKEKPPRSVGMPSVDFIPQPAQLRPPSRELETDAQTSSPDLVVPAGIRAVRPLLDRLGGGRVVNSGSAIKGLAYDRKTRQDWDYDVHLSLHGEWASLLPRFRVRTRFVVAWDEEPGGLYMTDEDPMTDDLTVAFLSTGELSTDDWLSWLGRAVVPYFKALGEEVERVLDSEGILDVHIGDYLYAEPSLVAEKARSRGGRVHVWPHSTNPVHSEFRGPGELSSVRGVTRTGCETWKRKFPEARVVHDSGLMLGPSEDFVEFQDGAPLSVVVIGGRPVMRNLPILDIESHENLYRDFFRRTRRSQDRGEVKIYFKPRGKTGEHELWLTDVVGKEAVWRRVLEHPLRLQLPNPVFVSLSVGSSALLEGLTRGIPGFTIEGGAARDYVAADEGVVQAYDLDAAVGLLRRLTLRAEWEDYRKRQTVALERELSH